MVKNSGMDLIETQLKLAAQKWKAKCRMTKHDQSWQDEDVSLSAERERGEGEGGREGWRERVTLSSILFTDLILGQGVRRAIGKGHRGQEDPRQRPHRQHQVLHSRILLLLPYGQYRYTVIVTCRLCQD